MRRRVRRLPAALAVGVLTVVPLLSGCGSGPGSIGPTGVDELTVPTPSPDPDDFVEVIDNAWLPLLPGSVWTYEVADSGDAITVTVTAGADPRDIAGVDTTPVTTTTTDDRDRVLATRTEWFAQDRSGNVWLFGASGTEYVAGAVRPVVNWLTGSGDAAGLAMAATPRVGDGHVRVPVAEDEVVVTVLSVDETLASLDGVASDVVLTEQRSSDQLGSTLGWYAPGLGLVRQTSTGGATWTLTALEKDEGSA